MTMLMTKETPMFLKNSAGGYKDSWTGSSAKDTAVYGERDPLA